MLSHISPRSRGRMVAARVLVASVLATAAVALVPQPALASCAEQPDLETAYANADIVFIGSVVELSNNDRTAVMEVEQVWKGPQLPDIVTVNGGPGDTDTFTSVDRTFEVGTYIVFPVNSTPPFEDNACTLTQRTTAALDVINPLIGEPLEEPSAEEVVTTIVAGDVGTSETSDAAGGEAAVPEPVSAGSGGSSAPILIAGFGALALGVGVYAWRRRSQADSQRTM